MELGKDNCHTNTNTDFAVKAVSGLMFRQSTDSRTYKPGKIISLC